MNIDSPFFTYAPYVSAGAVLGMLITVFFINSEAESIALKHNAVYYDAKTGELEWRQCVPETTKEPTP